MNIFVLDESPVISAQMMCDRHINKMVIESAQMLSTVHRMLDGTPVKRPSKSGKTTQTYYTFGDDRDDAFYLAVHKYHPCTVWTAASKANYEWHYEHFIALGDEFKYRYKKDHASIMKLADVLKSPPKNIPDIGMTPFAQAMNHYPECKVEGDAVAAYRNYYHAAKSFAKWEKARSAPNWWQGYQGG